MTFVENAEEAVDIIKTRTEVLFGDTETSVFNSNYQPDEYIKFKINKEFKSTLVLPEYLQKSVDNKKQENQPSPDEETDDIDKLIIRPSSASIGKEITDVDNQQLSLYNPEAYEHNASRSLIRYQQEHHQAYAPEKPEWHAPWKLMRVIAGHQGWVRSLAVEPENKWIASGSNDNTIKVWDLASGLLKLTLTGHIMTVRDLAISDRHPYMFSCSEDKTVKCWDLEKNQIIRDFYGHLSGVYSLAIHPTLDVLVTGSRDSTVRVWDIRTSTPIFTLTGHKQPVTQVECQATDPQIISTSNDKTIRLWDLAAGKTQTVLTHHKKSIRALALHPLEYSFATASPDNIKQWKFPEGAFLQNFIPRHDSIINTLSVNQDDVLFSGGDDGTMSFFDWKSGHKYQELKTQKLPGSLESESGIYTSTFDKTGMRLITGEVDKSIKVWRQDPEATPETHPGIEFDPQEYYRERY